MEVGFFGSHSWFVYELTGSALAISLVITTVSIAPLLSSLFAGSILDRYNRRLIMIAEHIIKATVVLLIPILFLLNILSLSFMIVLLFIQAFVATFSAIGGSSILPSLVKENQLESANTISNVALQVTSLIGPAVGGFLVGFIGVPFTLLIYFVCICIAAILFYLIPYSAYHKGIERTNTTSTMSEQLRELIKDTKEGFTFILKFPAILMIAIVTFFFNFTYAPIEPVLPLYINEILLSGSEALGLFWTTFAFGTLFGSFIWDRLELKLTYSHSLGSTIVLWGAAVILLAYSSSIYITYIVIFFGGLFYAPYNIVAPSLEQRLIPNRIRGRVLGLFYLIAGIGFPIGIYVGGILGETFGVIPTILFSGITTVILGGVVLLHKSLRFNVDNIPLKE